MPLFAEEGIWVDAVPGLSSLACLGISSPRIPIPYAICPVSQQRPHALPSQVTEGPYLCTGSITKDLFRIPLEARTLVDTDRPGGHDEGHSVDMARAHAGCSQSPPQWGK